ncbi:hypothetical protein AK830_g1159 [Neonectria ditissima]|uniref:Archaemetzincin-2 n=1 Tax=Neonectria ditissima TaxID=78410 RepID=A0A0P7BUT8_9HYPO|nr:hypothetical protein AK830_g1159 [Neonectria ditissima]
MSASRSSQQKEALCTHGIIYTDKSPHATALSYYEPPSIEQRLAASTRSTKPTTGNSTVNVPRNSTFPGVNLAPQDALDIDHKEAPQSLSSFSFNNYRNLVTPERRTLYVVDAPSLAPEASVMATWADPVVPPRMQDESEAAVVDASRPQVTDIAEYIQDFYHGLDVKVLRNHFCFAPWPGSSVDSRKGDGGNTRRSRTYVGLGLVDGDGAATRVRVRTSLDGVAPGQLNLCDVLDALHVCVPQDAFAVVLVTHHDLYEDEEDDFCAGRAYGGSRICVVSTFRYHPALDSYSNIDHAHSWPASHCRTYIDALWETSEPELKAMTKGKKGQSFDYSCMLRLKNDGNTPLAAAVKASRDSLTPRSKAGWDGIWLARVCRTASHELGHCVGMGHCVYYACVMQGTANMAEDVRQPPYLCPVCLAKVAYSVAGESVMKSRGTRKEERSQAAEDDWVVESYRRVVGFCERWQHVGMFKGYSAWLGARLRELGAVETQDGAEDNRGLPL